MTGSVPQAGLAAALGRLDGRGYRAYRDLEGAWSLGAGWILHLDRAQPDPFAPPSQLRLEIGPEVAAFAPELTEDPVRRLALCDFLLRAWARALGEVRGISCTSPGPEILERTDILLQEGRIIARFRAALPGRGRRIDGARAAALLTVDLLRAAASALVRSSVDASALQAHVEALEDQRALRGQLEQRDLVAFLADGAVLPRQSGVSPAPRAGSTTVPLLAPESLAVELEAPHAGRLRGLGFPCGVSLICGGAFHGKSTLLDAIAMGVYDHVPFDGRERCVTRRDATVHRTEPGRWVSAIDLRAFVGPLPAGADPASFRTENASGSTSQAASILEGLEAGSRVLLFDEDTSAGNLLAQDRAMRELLTEGEEPIVHLSRRLRQMHEVLGVSSVLVLGGSGAVFGHADRVVQMVEFRPRDVTANAHAIAETTGVPSPPPPWPEATGRRWNVGSLRPGLGRRAIAVRVHGDRELELGHHRADLRAWTQVVDPGQLRAAGVILGAVWREGDRSLDLRELLARIDSRLENEGLEWARHPGAGELTSLRPQDLLAVLARLRGCELTLARDD